MEKPNLEGNRFYQTVTEAIAFGQPADKTVKTVTREDFEAAVAHVARLLNDAAAAFNGDSFGTSVFLAITSLEETAKAELMAYRAGATGSNEGRGRDPLRNHGKKHRIAVRPATFMGRLPKILGQATCARLQREAESGGFVELRERAVYVHVEKDGVTTPMQVLSRQHSWEPFREHVPKTITQLLPLP